jgi:NAD-reducing hydrogenase small subunit
MSLLDLDERLLELAPRLELVLSPFVDAKEVPGAVDVALVEGAVSTEDHLALARALRASARLLVAMGDCAVTGNVTALRNGAGGPGPALARAFLELADLGPRLPEPGPLLPRLLDTVLPLHQVVPVDLFLPGCPPSADTLHALLADLVAGRTPGLAGRLHFG